MNLGTPHVRTISYRFLSGEVKPLVCWFIRSAAAGLSRAVGDETRIIQRSGSNTGWWFGTFFIFPYIGKNHPNSLIFFRGVAQPPTRIYGKNIGKSVGNGFNGCIMWKYLDECHHELIATGMMVDFLSPNGCKFQVFSGQWLLSIQLETWYRFSEKYIYTRWCPVVS